MKNAKQKLVLLAISLFLASCSEHGKEITGDCNKDWPDQAVSCVCIDSAWQCQYPESKPYDPCTQINCGSNEHCNETGHCVPDVDPCVSCLPNQYCENHQCVNNTPCQNDLDCSDNASCLNGSCVWGQDDEVEQKLPDFIVKLYNTKAGDYLPGKVLTLVDFRSHEYDANTTTDYVKDDEKIYRWSISAQKVSFRTPVDLSLYSGIRFKIYVPENAVNQAFRMCFSSGSEMCGYAHDIQFSKIGWNEFEYSLSSFNKTGNPTGWDDIGGLILEKINGNIENSIGADIYLGNINLFTESYTARSDKMIDFSSPEYAANASTDETKTGDKSFKWSFKNGILHPVLPQDLSMYQAMSFWVYVPENAVGQTFFMYFSSENDQTSNKDYYSKMVTLDKAGWVQLWFNLDELNKVQSPHGWNHIDSLTLTSKGWSQNNSELTTIYLDDFYFHTFTSRENDKLRFNGAMFSVNAPRTIIENKLVSHCGDDESCRVVKINGEFWLPLAVLGARYDANAIYLPKKYVLKMTLNENQYRFEGNKDTVEINGIIEKLGFTVKVIGSGLFVPEKYVQQLMGYTHRYENEMGMLYLSKEQDPVEKLDLNSELALSYELLFLRPSSTEIVAQMDRYSGGDIHPRIMLKQADFERLKALVKTDDRAKKYLDHLVNYYINKDKTGPFYADAVNYPKDKNTSEQLRIYRQAKNLIIPLSLLYKLTDDKVFLDRAMEEVQAVCKFEDWQPGSYLNTAEIMYAVSVAYDWLYHDMSKSDRELIENAILEKGLKTGLDVYEKRAKKWGKNNWSSVCNGGLATAALTFAHVKNVRESAQRVLNYAIRDVELGLYSYAPDGGFLESPMYWAYATDYLHVMYSALESAAGTNYGLYYSPGFQDSRYFVTNLENKAGVWGFHDSSSSSVDKKVQLWMARKSHDSVLAGGRYHDLDEDIKLVHAYDLMWYSPELDGDWKSLSLDAYYSEVGVNSMHSSWGADSILTGLHGGYNKADHGDLDIGNFILYAGSNMFIVELGPDDYQLPGYFGDKRNTYYRKRAEGQNTLVIGDVSSAEPDQTPDATGVFLRRESNVDSAISVVDMTTAYKQADQGRRGLLFKDRRSTVVVQDEMSLKTEQIVRWAVHTMGGIEVFEDGRSAEIHMFKDKDHKVIVPYPYLYAEIVSADKNLRFTTGPAKSYDGKYKVEPAEKDIKSYQKMMIVTDNKVKTFNTAVAFKVIYEGEKNPEPGSLYSWQDMSLWKLE